MGQTPIYPEICLFKETGRHSSINTYNQVAYEVGRESDNQVLHQ